MENNIYEKLLNIQSELKAPKGQYNSFGKYKYRNCEDILEAVKPLCVKHAVCIRLSDEIVFIGDRYYVKSYAFLYDTESDRSLSVCAYAREPQDRKGMDSSQITGASSSYARKYALNALLSIDDTKDADTDSGQHTEPVKAKKPLTGADINFYKVMTGYKKAFGEEEYRVLLGTNGYESCKDIPLANRKGALAFFAKKLEILNTEGGK